MTIVIAIATAAAPSHNASPAQAGRLGTNHGAGASTTIMQAPSSTFSEIAVAAASTIGTPSRRRSSQTRIASPARTGAIAEAAYAATV
jgi:hypothetical protein